MKKTCKTYTEKGITYQFNPSSLMMFINRKKSAGRKGDHKITHTSIREELADVAFVSQEAVKNWMYGNNAPSDIEQVKVIADYFDIDYHELLTIAEEKDMTMSTENILAKGSTSQQKYTKKLIRKIYHRIIDLTEAIHYYTDMQYYPRDLEAFKAEENVAFIKEGAKDMGDKLWELERMLHRGMLDIPTDSYKKIEKYIYGMLTNWVEGTAPALMYNRSDEDLERYLDENDWIFDYIDEDYLEDIRKVFAEYIPEN